MPEAIAAAVAYFGEALLAAGASDAGAAAIMYSTEIASALETVAVLTAVQQVQSRQQQAALDAYNSTLKNRYVMLRGSTEPRQIVLGRARVSGPWAFFASWGTLRDRFVMLVALAAHQIDGVEAIYFGDEQVLLDGSGYVVGLLRKETFAISSASASFELDGPSKAGTVAAVARYGSTEVALGVSVSGLVVTVTGAHSSGLGNCIITYQPDPSPYVGGAITSRSVDGITTTGAAQTVTLPYAPIAGTVTISTVSTSIDNPGVDLTGFSVTGSVVSFTAVAGLPVVINYQAYDSPSRARITVHLGAESQTADADLVSALPSTWTSNHRLRGTAYLKCEFWYDEKALAGGIPIVSAVVRGALCFDPRTSTTAWSDNPALCARFYALHPFGGRRNAATINNTSLIAAANICDRSATYVVGGRSYTRALYTCGYVVKSSTRPDRALDDLCLAMGGQWCIVDNQVVLQAGAWRTPVPLAIDRTWLSSHEPQQYRARPARSQIANVYMGTFADQEQDFKVTDWPQVPQNTSTDAIVLDDGAELPQTLEFAAVTFSGQAQYIAACLRRLQRAPVYSMGANMQAYPLEPFDIIAVTEPLFGLADDTFEVSQSRWAPPGAISLAMRKVDSAIWDMDSGGYTATAIAPTSRLQSPWDVAPPDGLSAVSNATTVQDGLATIAASWTAVTDARVTQDGNVELRWGRASDPEQLWQVRMCVGSATRELLSPIQPGNVYIIKIRSRTKSAASIWSKQIALAIPQTVVDYTGALVFYASAAGPVYYDNASIIL